MKKTLRIGLSALVAANAAVIITGVSALVAPSAIANAPGNPGTSAPPVVLYQETFENGQATGAGSAPSLLSGYTGAAPANMTYSADPYYLNPASCNGVIASFNSANPSGWCGNNATYWNYVKGFAAALSSLQAAPTDDNHALIDFTTNGSGSAGAVVLQSATNDLPLSGTQKRFLTMSVDVAEAYCSNGPSGNAKLNFYLETAAGEHPLQSQPVQPCNSPSTVNVVKSVPGAGNIAYRTGTVSALGSVLTIPANFGFKVVNDTTVAGGGGNDMAYDNFTVIDATPQLDANFSSATADPDAVTNLVYTITNTSDLADKDGWAFSKALPAGLVVNGTPSTTCAAADLSGITGSTVDVTGGDIAQGVTSCTITIPVSAANGGTYKVASSGTSLVGLDAPDDTTLTVAARNVFKPGPGVTTPQNKPVITPITGVVTTTGKPVDPTSVTQVTPPTHGKIVIDPTTGEVTYTPDPGTSGVDHYTINVCDTSSPAQCHNITVPVTVSPNVVTAPNKSTTVKTGQVATFNVLKDAHSKSGQQLAKPTVSKPKHGTAKVNPDGSISYKPARGFVGTDVFTYTLCDTGTPKACVTRTLTVHVKGAIVVPSLPDTGGPSLGLLLGGGAALLGGFVLMMRGRRRA